MRSIVLILALLFSTAVFAGGYKEQAPNENVAISASQASSSAGALALAGGSTSNSLGVNGGINTNTSIVNDTRMPASPAIAPSVGTANDCQVATPSSKAFSVLVFSASGTTGVTYNDLCFAFKTGQIEVAEKLMCKQSKDYYAANDRCKTFEANK